MNQNVMTIYPAGTTNFDYQGYGTLYDAYSAEVTEASSTNGNITETMEITYPVNGVLSDKIVEGNLVKAQISKTDGDYQIFEIDETEKSDNTVITAYLNAYPYRVLRMSFSNGGKFANFETLTRLLDYAKSYMPDLPTDFNITTNISNPINLSQVQTDPSLTPVPTVFKDFSSLLDAILNKVSGQVKFGPRSIEILAHRGQDKSNIELRDDKNTNGISVKIDTTNIVNKIIPLLPVKDKDGNSTSETVVGRIVTPKDPFRFINFYSGQVVNVDTQDLANSYFSRTNCNYPVTTATVTTSMIDEDLSDIRLFDVVSVYSSRINYTAKLKVSERVFDVLAGAVDSFKLGTSSVNVFSTQTAAMNQVEQAVGIGNQALTSANGKNTNYYGDSKPTDGKEGDIWFHTVDGVSQMDQFTGGVWKTIVSDTFGKEVDKKVSTAQAEASDAKTKAEEGVAKAESTAAKFDDTNQKVKQALDNSVSAQSSAASAVAKANSTASEFGKVKQTADSALSTALSAQTNASSAVAKANSTASEFGKVKQDTASAVASALAAQNAASSAVSQASSAAADSKDAKQIAGAVSQSYKTLTDGSTMTIAELQSGLAAKLTKTDLNGYATQDWSQNQIKMTADGINGTISSIKGKVDSQTTSINDLKADSSSFKSQFTTVNNTLGKQTTDISSLQASSKELSSNFSSLNTDNTTNKNDISQLKQTATEVSSTLETVETQVQNSAVGTNLIVHTGEIANSMLNSYGDKMTGWNQASVMRDKISVTAGEKLTFHQEQPVDSIYCFRYNWYDADGTYLSRDAQPGKGLFTVTVPANASALWVSYPNVGRVKVERGTTATDWSPAPEDLATVTAVSKISQTVDGMQTDISKKIEKTDLNGYATQDWAQNQIKLTADGINGTISSVKNTVDGHATSINDLKADSSSFKSQFMTVNDTIGKHTSDIGSLQASSKELTSGFNTLTNDNTTNKNDISQLKQTATEVSSTLETVKTQVQNSAVGINLAIGTNQEYAMGYGIHNTSWTDGYAYLKLPTNVYNGEILPQDPHTFWCTLDQGVTYTQTIWFETDATVKDLNAAKITWFTGEWHDFQPATIQKLDQNIYKVVSTYMWPGKSENNVRLFDIEHLDYAFDLRTGTYLKFGRLKLEKGSLSTDWCPNPADNATVTEVSKISQTVDGMQTDISKKIEQKDLKGYATETWTNNQIKLTSDSISATLSSVKNTVDGHTTSINDLQADSRGFKVQFTTVNNTIGKHTTDIGTLQASAKSLSASFDSLNTDNGTNQHNISELQQSAKEFNSTLTTVKTQVQNSAVGTNLLQGTGTASGDVAVGSGTLVNGAFNGSDAVKTYSAWTERCINLKQSLGRTNAKAGDWYTISVYVKADKQIDTGTLNVYRALGTVDAHTNDGVLDHISMHGKPITTQWQQYSWSFQINDISLQRQDTRVEYGEDISDNWIYWAGWKLEKGSVATDWCANPADNATVTAVSSISQTIESIQTTVRGKADQSKITQLDNQITSMVGQINSFSKSTRNMVINSQFQGNYLDGKSWTGGTTKVWYKSADTWSWVNGYQGICVNQPISTFSFPSIFSRKIAIGGDLSIPWSASAYVNVDTVGSNAVLGIGFYNNKGESIAFHTSSKKSSGLELMKVENMVPPAGTETVCLYFIVQGGGHAAMICPMLNQGDKAAAFVPDDEEVQRVYSAIGQATDQINLRVEKNDVINAINISPEGTQIYGNKLHITASTYIDNAIIKDAMISNVSADKMTTGTLNAANVNVINLNGSHIVSNSITSNQLASGSVTANKIQSGAIRVSLNNSLQRLEIGVDGMNLMSDAGDIIGRIHSNHMDYDSTFWGLAFDMSANGGDFMSWGAQNNGDVNGLYQTKLAWYRWSTHGYDEGFHFQDRVEFHDKVEFRNEIDTRANYLLKFGSTNVNGYSSVPYLGLSGGATKISFSPGSVWLSRHNNYYNMGAVIEGFSHYLGKAVFIPTGMHSDGRASSWTGVNIPSE